MEGYEFGTGGMASRCEEDITCVEGAESVAAAMGAPHLTATGSLVKSVRVWDLRSKRLQVFIFRGHGDSVLSLKWVEGGRTVVSASKHRSVKIWDTRTGRVRSTLNKHFGSVSIIRALPVEPHSSHRDGPAFVIGARDGMISMWTNDGDCLQSQRGHRNSVNCLSEIQSYNNNNIDPSMYANPSFISSGGDNVVKVWESRRLKVISSLNAASVVKIAWFHQSIITGSSTGSISCWNLQSVAGDTADGADLSRTWTSKELGTLSLPVTDIVADKCCVCGRFVKGRSDFAMDSIITS